MDKGLTGQRDIKKMQALASASVSLWGLSGSLKLLGETENLVYEVDGHILRLTENHHRTVSELTAELDFISALSDAGVSVAQPLKSSHDILVETVEGYHISVFKKAKGDVKKPKEAFLSLETARNLGRELGKTHKVTKTYVPKKNKRHQSSDIPYNKDGLSFIPVTDDIAVREFKKAMDWVKTLPKDNNVFGLVHMDAHTGNFCVDKNEKITLFDFDDCAYNFFAYDLAIPLNHLKFSKLSDTQKQKAREALLEGYTEEYILPQEHLDMIDGFIRFRNIEMYAWTCMMFGAPEKDGKELSFVSHYQLTEDFTKPYPVFKNGQQPDKKYPPNLPKL